MESPPLAKARSETSERLLAVTVTQGMFLAEPGMVVTPLSGLTAALLADIRPTRIVTPLFSGGVDATLVIERLEDLGYGGEITVIAPNLPRPMLVQAELRALGPGLRLVLVNGLRDLNPTPRSGRVTVCAENPIQAQPQTFPRSR